ncbi:hypothetical protein ACPUYX_20735, partial [Desulfosporosinus sp. SYSU MS00001]
MSSTVATIEFENPTDLITTDTGAETQGQAYTLSVPSLATEPITVTAPNGEYFSWQPQMLLYQDEIGVQDFIIESMPSDLTILGRQARYLRTFANADDVFHAQNDRVKHWTVLNEPPRPAAEYLSGVIQFGISGIINGTILQEGTYDSIENGIFNLPKPIIKDLTGQEIEGNYEVVNSDKGQILYIWFDASFLNQAVYPIMIDPTVIIASAYDTFGNGGRKIVRLSNGWFVCMVYDSSFPEWNVYKSTDNGVTFSYLGNIKFGSAPNGVTQDASMVANGTKVTFVYGCKGSGGTGIYSTAVDITTVAANTELTNLNFVNACGSTIYQTINSVTSTIDNNGKIHIAYDYDNSYATDIYYNCSSDGGNTWGTPTQITHLGTANGRYNTYPSITIGKNGYPLIAWQGYDGAEYLIRYSYFNGSTWQLGGNTNYGLGIYYSTTYNQKFVSALTQKYGPNAGRTWVVWQGVYPQNTSTYHIYGAYSDDMVNWSALIDLALGTNPILSEDKAGNVYTLYDYNGDGYLYLLKCAAGTATFGNLTRMDAGANPNIVDYELNSMIGYIFKTASAISFDKILLNQPPLAPTLNPQQNFDATVGATFTWTFNDPDIGNTQSAFQLQIIKVSDGSVVKDTGKTVSTNSSYTLLANTLINTQQYQWRVMTWDNSDVSSPWSTLGTFNTYAPSTLTVTNPTDNATIPTSSITVAWNFNDNQGLSQSSYQVKLTDNADNILFDSGKVADTNARALTINYTLDNNTAYKTKITLWNSGGIQSTEVVRAFSTSFTPPATPTISSTQDNIRGAITLNVVNPLPALSLTVDFKSKTAGDTTGNPNIAKYMANSSLQAPNATYTYNNAVTNGDFSNGTTGWSSTNSTGFTASNNVASFIATAQYGSIRNSISNFSNYIGHKLYFSARIKSTSSNVILALNDGIQQPQDITSGSNMFEKLS